MEKLVLILSKSIKDSAKIAGEVDALPGVFVKGFSRSLVDVEASAPEAAEQLRGYAREHGFEVEQMSAPTLIEPISPFGKGVPFSPSNSEEEEG
ncbi:hypothetical protein [Aminobacter sp. HY435]|uniref:hypothetical protein n=1 Tax=Aminobacter sp. HY435 TaxID=2970917 RepID=UPI0022B95BF5|nr:hypothetical protein [Aminobacter sp. HY435]